MRGTLPLLTGVMYGDHDVDHFIYCGDGSAASSNAFIMARLGFTNIAVYTDSLQAWVADPANPIVVEML